MFGLIMTEELTTGSRKKAVKNLPWWVEILFVQIGLPDSWLRSILKARKKSKRLIQETPPSTLIIISIFISLAYIAPIVRHSTYHNRCVDDYKRYISRSTDDESIISANSISYRYCSGGSNE